MNFFEEFSKNMSNITGISSVPILLTTYSIIAIIVTSLIAKGLIFLNTELNKNERNIYIINKKVKIAKIILLTIALFFIWEDQIKNIMTFISFVGAAATLAIREVIANFFAGIYISLKKPFKVEDRIEIKDSGGNITGDVVNINSLNFEILEVSNKEQGEQSTGIIIQVPNSKVLTNPVKNYTKAFKYIWNELEVKIKLEANLKENKTVLYEIVKNNDIVKRIPKKMKDQLNNVIGDYRIYYNNLDPIIYTKLTPECIELKIRYLAHPKKARHIESQIWNKIYEAYENKELELYVVDKEKKKETDANKDKNEEETKQKQIEKKNNKEKKK